MEVKGEFVDMLTFRAVNEFTAFPPYPSGRRRGELQHSVSDRHIGGRGADRVDRLRGLGTPGHEVQEQGQREEEEEAERGLKQQQQQRQQHRVQRQVWRHRHGQVQERRGNQLNGERNNAGKCV